MRTAAEILKRVAEANQIALSDQQKLALEIAMETYADDVMEQLGRALRQWKMYAEMEDRDLRTEVSAEAEMWRAAFKLAPALSTGK